MNTNSLRQVFLSILGRKDEATMWSAFRTLISGKSNSFIMLKELEERNIYVCKKGEEHIFIMLDHHSSDGGEMANEDACIDTAYPHYHTSMSTRISPVYELYSYMIAFSKHSDIPMAMVAGLLLTDSRIVNAEDMTEGWKNLHISVRDKLHSVKINMQRLCSNDDLPSSDIASFQNTVQENIPYYDVERYSSLFKEEYEDDNWITDYDSLPERINIAAWVEDDPDFYDLLPGGKKVLSIPKVEVYRRRIDPEHSLMELIGLADVKQKIHRFGAFASYNTLMSNLNLSTQGINAHALFVGGVGVGKTTVAKLYASLLYNCGLLSTGQVVVADRSTFVDKYWGHAERTLSKILKLATGGVLLIDEAYLLNPSSDDRDPGRVVIQMLLEVLADQKSRDIAIVLAGYHDKIMELLALNPGLESRFPNVYHFEDFNLKELNSIAVSTFEKGGYNLTDEARCQLEKSIRSAYEKRNTDTWGNAREMHNIYEATILKHAERCMAKGITAKDVEILITIEPDDIATPYLSKTSITRLSKIGFK